MEYKGFKGSVETDGNIHYGKITNIKDLVTYESLSYEGLKTAFEEAVDDYIETVITLKGLAKQQVYLDGDLQQEINKNLFDIL